MTAHNFPSSPQVGDISVAGAITYKWNGSRWIAYPGAVTAPINTTYNGVMDLNQANYYKMPLTYSGVQLAVTQSFINVPSGSFKCYVELVQDRSINQNFLMSTASYSGVSSSAFANSTGIFIRADGKKAFNIGTGAVLGYDLTTAWDISTMVYRGESFTVSGQETTVNDCYFMDDGTKMYIIGSASDRIHSYTLSVPWMLSSAIYDGIGAASPTLTAQDATPRSMAFKPDGTKVFVKGSTNDTVYSYTMSTPWDLSTITYDSLSFSIVAQTGAGSICINMNAAGTKMYASSDTNDAVYAYTLSTPWNISTATYDASSFSTLSIDAAYASGHAIKPDGSRFFAHGITARKIYEYTGVFGTITWDSRIIWGGGGAPKLLGTGSQLIEFFSPDGGNQIYGTIIYNNT